MKINKSIKSKVYVAFALLFGVIAIISLDNGNEVTFWGSFISALIFIVRGPRGKRGFLGDTGAMGPKGDMGEKGKDAV